jgi:hypothetical protein
MSRSRGRRAGSPPVVEGQVVGRARTVNGGGPGYSLGDLTADAGERGPLLASFGYFGADIRVNPDLTEIDMIDFLDEAEKVQKDDPRSMLMVKEAARSHVHPDDFDEFWKLRKQHRQGVEALMSTIWGIVAGVTGHPTGPPSDSSDGRQDTKPNSPGPSLVPDDDQSLRGAYLRQIDRFERMTDEDGNWNPMGVAMAAQVAAMAEARGIDVSRADPSPVLTG